MHSRPFLAESKESEVRPAGGAVLTAEFCPVKYLTLVSGYFSVPCIWQTVSNFGHLRSNR